MKCSQDSHSDVLGFEEQMSIYRMITASDQELITLGLSMLQGYRKPGVYLNVIVEQIGVPTSFNLFIRRTANEVLYHYRRQILYDQKLDILSEWVANNLDLVNQLTKY